MSCGTLCHDRRQLASPARPRRRPALMRENSEAFVTGNETIKRSITSLRAKMDLDHAALAKSQATLSERVHLNYAGCAAAS